ncbi:phosphoribosylaminoimidazolesuccinocarboxamide synthase [Flavisolibacter ginsengisoli]|jgi:phosphoribosylaminoimidazole-succinocarboxamide synthase|uniref:Phosphoribosylaminoimidazole-succinocarboxamide synthase n=1 Tax=Flavisolibacter ginsengisoli DSM 18119 TaxID=1121884 RepID=A0A1M5BLS3_9BACT|nr:phosphoribosylaminoimidazolesuccinocarboxamide synthase [Flavisolibacter ginsengisoli]SHF43340.1 phosphoribosylaminoimidazole-succinocarboxamide synthase [Flavisolibacter ginsengisoli DSM 18119]
MANFQFPGQTTFYRGKVRDVYTINNNLLVMIASDRISAFDVILPRGIPYKGQVLNQLASFMLKATSDICPNWLLETPTANSSIGNKCEPFKVEVVVRGNLCGHAWRTYSNGQRVLCGALMPDGLKENDLFPTPLITPSTKASEGHDEDISENEIIEQGLVPRDEWTQIKTYALALFERGKELALKQGLILADTKYEFGKRHGQIVLMDEIHTPDSSRYFYADGFAERQEKGEKQKQLSKEFVREWLIQNEFMGKEGQTVPAMSDEWVETISKRYIELYEKVTGTLFTPQDLEEEENFKLIAAALSKYQ